MIGERYRIVYTIPGRELYISSVVFAADEIEAQLAVETQLHEKAGWAVTPGDNLIVCRRGNALRIIEAKAFDPFGDSPNDVR